MTLAIVGIVVFLILIMLGMNIGLSLLLVGAIGYSLAVNPAAALGVLKTLPATQASTYALMVIPMFVIMGNFAFIAGLSDGLYTACNKWLSRLPGNLACGTIAACAGFSAICGSCAATAATMGTIAVPEMRKYGYADQLATGSVAMGGTLGVLIPPSTLFVIYGITAEASVGRLFAAGIIPGIMLSILCIITIVILVKANPKLAPPPFSTPWGERFRSLTGLVPIVVIFVVVLGGIFTGFFTVNQSAAIGAILAALFVAIKRKLNWKSFIDVMTQSVQTTAMTFLIMIGASVFCNFLSITGFPTKLAGLISDLAVSKYIILLLMTIIYLILGAIMDELPMLLMTVPIFLPIVTALGYDPIWFGVYVILCMEMGAIAPPVGLTCFIISGIAKDVPLGTIYRGAIPFLITIFVAIALITVFPPIATFLPDLLFGVSL
jgi:tripartite ATP-independent transporter DctM subunit